MAKEQKTNLYLLSIVAIVAIVGIVVLILNSGAGSVSLSSDDLSGEAYKLSIAKTTLGESGCSPACPAGTACVGGECYSSTTTGRYTGTVATT